MLKEKAKKVKIEGSRMYNPGWHMAFDLQNMIVYAEAIAKCALQRKESRGAHSRLDFTSPNPEDAKWNSIVKKGNNGEMIVNKIPTVSVPEEIKKVLVEDKSKLSKYTNLLSESVRT